jgi:PHD/YefM family antitoxin component YafN of YafNO toxin-antitoxin module
MVSKGDDKMPKILPIRELKNTAAISKFVEETNEPVFITKNGYGSMVIMNLEIYERMVGTKGLTSQNNEENHSLEDSNPKKDNPIHINEHSAKYGQKE